ncbi:MAG: type II secretion system F family protein [Halobacteriota archaeon]|nr:type II secretion system F family protein [Halobacteriota archaeon]
MSLVDDIAFQLFGKRTSKKPYYKLQKKLRQAHIGVPSDRYVAYAMFVSLIVGAIGGLISYMLIGFFLQMELPFTFYVTEGSIQEWMVFHKEALISLLVVPIFILVFAQITYRIILLYPSLTASTRRSQIDATIPHAVTFMYAMSKGGVNIMDIFRSLHEHSNVYGGVGKEAGMVVRDLDYFGHNITTALRNVGDITPSEKFKSFTEGLISTIDSGGNLTSYLSAKSIQLQNEAVQEQKSFLETLSIIAEMYVTAFVAFPLFLITIIVVMGMMSGGYLSFLQLIVYLVIPVGSFGFLMVLDIISNRLPDQRALYTESKKLEIFKNAQTIEPKKSEEHLFYAFERYDQIERIRAFIQNPLSAIFDEPSRALYISIPVGLLYLAALIWPMWVIAPLTINDVDEYLIISLLIILTPFVFFYEVRERRIKNMEDAIPDFLTGLASIQDAGLTLAKAIKLILSSNLGVLSSEIRKMWGEIQWGSTTSSAFIRFERRVRTGSISRTVALITKASEVSGDIREVLNIAARDATTSKSLRLERRANMSMYVIVVYISFAVFLFIIIVLTTMFLPRVPTDINMGGQGAAGVGEFFGQGFDLEAYKTLFFHAVIIQGLFSGLIAGQMGEGNILSGLKHSVIMMVIAFVLFMFL